jgi:hypothetical protein
MANPLSPIWSNIANRKDHANQKFWTEFRQYGYVTGGTPTQANGYVVLGPDGKIDSSLLPASGSTVRVNGTAVPNPNFNDNLPAAPAGSSNVKWQYDLITGNVSAYYTTSGTSVTFDQILTGNNTSAQMTVSGTATLTYSGTGVVNANQIGTINVAGNLPTHPGQILISQPGNTAAVWADPQVQGLYAAGSSVASPPPYTSPTTICPVLIGGEDQTGKTTNLQTTVAGDAIVLTQDQETNASVLRFSATTGITLVVNTTNTPKPILSIKPKVGATTTTFTLRMSDFLSQGQITHYQLLLNATLTGSSFVNVDAASNAQYDVSATSYTGGRMIDSGFIGADHERNEFELRFGFTGGTPDTITLVFAPIAGSAKSTAGAGLAWDEQTQPL